MMRVPMVAVWQPAVLEWEPQWDRMSRFALERRRILANPKSCRRHDLPAPRHDSGTFPGAAAKGRESTQPRQLPSGAVRRSVSQSSQLSFREPRKCGVGKLSCWGEAIWAKEDCLQVAGRGGPTRSVRFWMHARHVGPRHEDLGTALPPKPFKDFLFKR